MPWRKPVVVEICVGLGPAALTAGRKKSDGDGAPIAESAGGAVIAVRSCGVAILAGMILYGAIWAGHGFSGPARWCAIAYDFRPT